MNKKILAAVVALSLTAFSEAQAQKRNDSKQSGKPVITRISTATVFLGASAITGGEVADRMFDSLVTQSLTARDSMGNSAKVEGFTLTFAERGIFEDSAGNPMLSVDYYTEICTGDTLTTLLRNTLPERTKPGDTVWIDRITASNSAGMQLAGKAMKFVIGRNRE